MVQGIVMLQQLKGQYGAGHCHVATVEGAVWCRALSCCNKTTVIRHPRTFLIISRSLLLRMKNVSDKTCRGTRNTHFNLITFFFEKGTFYEKMWKNTVERGRGHGNMCPAHRVLGT